ncbi:MAG TPA: adenylate/guanylate cyclase domain-containing protein [Algoriphagus sp.]|nr:adenylate/guanylate cyclase domain-containing protein [Algoriphagus sp.]
MQAELNRKQSTVYFSDIVGYTRLMGRDENAAFELMKDNLNAHQEIFAKYNGQVVKELGDGILGIFATPKDALNAALEIQKICIFGRRFELRIGIHCGDVIFDHGDVFGDAVNQSSRIQSVGVPSSILISEKLHHEIEKDPEFHIQKMGAFSLKNVEHEVELYALTNPPLRVPKRHEILDNIKYQERNPWKNRLGIGAILVLLIALIYSVFLGDTSWEKDKSIAVIPFTNLSGNKDFDYFPSALTQNLIDQLSKIGSIKSISYNTMKSFTNPNSPIDSIASILKVSTILKGTVENLGSGVRISLQLIDVKENKNIWTESYIREGSNIPQFQNEIARELARILDARLTAEEATQIGKGETTNPEAYDLVFKAKDLYKSYEDSSLLLASQYLKEAIELDQNYALAYTWLAKTYYQLGFNHPDSIWYDLSLEMSEKALALEPKLAEGFSARGATYYYLGQITKAKNSLDLATSFNPNFSEAIGNLATIYFIQGDLLKAMELQKKSARLNPKSYLPYQNIGWTYKILGEYQLAHEWFENSLEQNEIAATYELKALAFLQEGKRDSAINQAEKILNMKYPNFKELGYIYFYSNEMDSAFNVLEKGMNSFSEFNFSRYASLPIPYSYLLKQKGDHQLADSILNKIIQVKIEAISLGYEDYYLPLDLATAFAVKNQSSESLKYLQIAYEKGWRDYFFTEYNPIFNNLKSDDRYKKILALVQNDIEEAKIKLSSTSLQRDK